MALLTVQLSQRLLLIVAVLANLASFYLWMSISSTSNISISAVKQSPLDTTKEHFLENPLGFEDFGEMGRRVQILRGFIEQAENPSLPLSDAEHQLGQIEEIAVSMFPFLRPPFSKSHTPLQSLRQSYLPGSRGIIIPTGRKKCRFTAHLIASLRTVLNSSLPIQVAYSGEGDLPEAYRKALVSLGVDIGPLDVSKIFDNTCYS